jgi:hypothetical protein
MSDNDINNNTNISITEDEKKAWIELWEFASGCISVNNIGIDIHDFINDGKLLFEIKLKPTDN